jgi:flagellar basal-body rod protein FlgG
MTQGSMAQTGNTLDVAIQGTGWFKILMPDGTFSYTRDGSFQMDSQGRIVTAEGNLVQPTITVPAGSSGLTINQQGQVSVTPAGSTTSSILGQFTLTTFINDAGLQANGDNLFTATPASGTPQDGTPGTNGAGTLLQGSLEQSNVEAVTEISNLIAAQRAYEMNSKVVTAADEMLQTTSQLAR